MRPWLLPSLYLRMSPLESSEEIKAIIWTKLKHFCSDFETKVLMWSDLNEAKKNSWPVEDRRACFAGPVLYDKAKRILSLELPLPHRHAVEPVGSPLSPSESKLLPGFLTLTKLWLFGYKPKCLKVWCDWDAAGQQQIASPAKRSQTGNSHIKKDDACWDFCFEKWFAHVFWVIWKFRIFGTNWQSELHFCVRVGVCVQCKFKLQCCVYRS